MAAASTQSDPAGGEVPLFDAVINASSGLILLRQHAVLEGQPGVAQLIADAERALLDAAKAIVTATAGET